MDQTKKGSNAQCNQNIRMIRELLLKSSIKVNDYLSVNPQGLKILAMSTRQGSLNFCINWYSKSIFKKP